MIELETWERRAVCNGSLTAGEPGRMPARTMIVADLDSSFPTLAKLGWESSGLAD